MKRLTTILAIAMFLCGGLRGDEDRPVQFKAYDLTIDSGDDAVTAWQIEFAYDRDRVAVVGIEGSELFPADNPPFYDSAGMKGGRLMLGSYTTEAAGLQTGRIRIARLHLQVTDRGAPELGATLIAAARPGGERITPSVDIKEFVRK